MVAHLIGLCFFQLLIVAKNLLVAQTAQNGFWVWSRILLCRSIKTGPACAQPNKNHYIPKRTTRIGMGGTPTLLPLTHRPSPRRQNVPKRPTVV